MGMVRSGVRVGHPVYMVAKDMCVGDLVVMSLNGYIVIVWVVVRKYERIIITVLRCYSHRTYIISVFP